jgi:hypothetical protein
MYCKTMSFMRINSLKQKFRNDMLTTGCYNKRMMANANMAERWLVCTLRLQIKSTQTKGGGVQECGLLAGGEKFR